MKKFKELNLKIVEKYKFFAPVALAIIIIGVILMCTIGMNIGLDFAGGSKITVNFTLSFNSELKDEAKNAIIEEVKKNGFKIGNERWADSDTEGVIYEIGIEYDKKINEVDDAYQKEFLDKIQGTKDNSYEDGLTYKIAQVVKTYDSEFEKENCTAVIVGSSTARKLLKAAIIAASIAVVAMLVYIAFRFTLASGLAAILCLCHDVLIMFTLTTIFRVQVNTTFIAAVITIIGYSINATIVIFDRIRELRKQPSLSDFSDAEIANKAISNTLGRTIITTATTLVTILTLFIVCEIMNVSAMGEFALPIIFGLIAGMYSSVFLASSTWVFFKKLGAKMKRSK